MTTRLGSRGGHPALLKSQPPAHLRTASCCTTIFLTEPPSNKQEALRLAEAQVPNLQLRRSDALISKLYLNAKDAAWVCRLASCYFTSQGNPNPITTCRVHSWGDGSPSQRGILPHERARILHSWYFLKLHTGPLLHWGHERARIVHSWYLLNLHTGPLLHWAQQHHQSLTQELWAMSALQAYVLWAMASFLCELTDENAGEVRISFQSLALIVIVSSFIRFSS